MAKKENREKFIRDSKNARNLAFENLQKQNPDNKYVVTVPDDAIIDIQVSGYFRRKFEEVFYYLLSPLNAQEIVEVMQKIKAGFANVPKEDIKLIDDAVDTMMTLINEINYQAAKQKKTVVTDQHINESLANFLSAEGTEENRKTATEVLNTSDVFNEKLRPELKREVPIDFTKELKDLEKKKKKKKKKST